MFNYTILFCLFKVDGVMLLSFSILQGFTSINIVQGAKNWSWIFLFGESVVTLQKKSGTSDPFPQPFPREGAREGSVRGRALFYLLAPPRGKDARRAGKGLVLPPFHFHFRSVSSPFPISKI